MCTVCVLFFFVTQKTAYEMRISDWSSDVGSSDLGDRFRLRLDVFGAPAQPPQVVHSCRVGHHGKPGGDLGARGVVAAQQPEIVLAQPHEDVLHHVLGRSEEHTSELQSIMRISYAVFCLQKKNHDTH